MIDWWKIIIPALSGILGVALAAITNWWLSERSKKKWEIFFKKEKIYVKMLELSRGFYVSSLNKEQINQFVDMTKLLWLYASDDVIKKTYEFINAVHEQKEKTTDQQRHNAMEALVFALRKDIIQNKIPKKTNLSAADYQHIRAT